jgi:hypothetical protein
MVAAALAVLGVPAAASAVWQDTLARHPVAAAVLALVYWGLLGVVALVAKAAARPTNRRLEQLGEAVDRALGRRFSRYGRRYREHIATSLRLIDNKGLATGGPHTPELDEVFVDVGLAPRAPHQVPGGMLANVPDDVTQRNSLSDLLDHERPVALAVIGAPGSGKTTLSPSLTAVIAQASVLQVRPFTDEQVRRFLRGWYLATERHAVREMGPDVEQRAQAGAADLLARIAAAPAILDLTVNPLLLTMIANVHRYRGALPGSRADLYSEVCQVMLWRRQEAKNLAVELPGASKERLLAQLAYTMMRRRVRDLSREHVLEILRPGLERVSKAATVDGFLADVGNNGLLVERERDLYAFAHHTFGEYLAARHIKDNGLAQVLADTVDDVWWRETTLLYVAGTDADPIVQAWLGNGTATAMALAFDCADGGGGELAPDLRDQLEKVLAGAFHDDVAPERRRLVAAVLATRHLRSLVTTAVGARVCPQPFTTNIYWLFIQDTHTPAQTPPARLPPTHDNQPPASGARTRWPSPPGSTPSPLALATRFTACRPARSCGTSTSGPCRRLRGQLPFSWPARGLAPRESKPHLSCGHPPDDVTHTL